MKLIGNLQRVALLCSITLGTVLSTYAQGDVTNAPDHTTGSVQLNINDLPLRSVRYPNLSEVGGSIFLTRDFNKANIVLKDGGIVKNIPVKFNLYNNAVIVIRDGSEMKVEPFKEVSYTEYNAAGEPKQFVFRQGYPDVDNFTDNTIYQVLASGPKVQLLRFYNQKVEDAPTLGDYSRRELVTNKMLFLYVAGEGIKKVSLGKKAVSGIFPSLATASEEIVKTEKLNLKNESDLIQLVEALNK